MAKHPIYDLKALATVDRSVATVTDIYAAAHAAIYRATEFTMRLRDLLLIHRGVDVGPSTQELDELVDSFLCQLGKNDSAQRELAGNLEKLIFSRVAYANMNFPAHIESNGRKYISEVHLMLAMFRQVYLVAAHWQDAISARAQIVNPNPTIRFAEYAGRPVLWVRLCDGFLGMSQDFSDPAVSDDTLTEHCGRELVFKHPIMIADQLILEQKNAIVQGIAAWRRDCPRGHRQSAVSDNPTSPDASCVTDDAKSVLLLLRNRGTYQPRAQIEGALMFGRARAESALKDLLGLGLVSRHPSQSKGFGITHKGKAAVSAENQHQTSTDTAASRQQRRR